MDRLVSVALSHQGVLLLPVDQMLLHNKENARLTVSHCSFMPLGEVWHREVEVPSQKNRNAV